MEEPWLNSDYVEGRVAERKSPWAVLETGSPAADVAAPLEIPADRSLGDCIEAASGVVKIDGNVAVDSGARPSFVVFNTILGTVSFSPAVFTRFDVAKSGKSVSEARTLAKGVVRSGHSRYAVLVHLLGPRERTSEHFHLQPEWYVGLAGNVRLYLEREGPDPDIRAITLKPCRRQTVAGGVQHTVFGNTRGALWLTAKKFFKGSRDRYHRFEPTKVAREFGILLSMHFQNALEREQAMKRHLRFLEDREVAVLRKRYPEVLREMERKGWS